MKTNKTNHLKLKIISLSLMGLISNLIGACDSEIYKYGNHFYKVTENRLEFAIAKQVAINDGGYLAIPNDSGENDFLKSLTAGNSLSWIGIYDPNYTTNYCYLGNTCINDDSRFKTVLNTIPTYKNWSGGEPNNLVGQYDIINAVEKVSPLGEHWVALAGANGRWFDLGNHINDINNPVKYNAIIEYDTQPLCYQTDDVEAINYALKICNTQIWDGISGNLDTGTSYNCLQDQFNNDYCPSGLAIADSYWDYLDGYSVVNTDTTVNYKNGTTQEYTGTVRDYANSDVQEYNNIEILYNNGTTQEYTGTVRDYAKKSNATSLVSGNYKFVTKRSGKRAWCYNPFSGYTTVYSGGVSCSDAGVENFDTGWVEVDELLTRTQTFNVSYACGDSFCNLSGTNYVYMKYIGAKLYKKEYGQRAWCYNPFSGYTTVYSGGVSCSDAGVENFDTGWVEVDSITTSTRTFTVSYACGDSSCNLSGTNYVYALPNGSLRYFGKRLRVMNYNSNAYEYIYEGTQGLGSVLEATTEDFEFTVPNENYIVSYANDVFTVSYACGDSSCNLSGTNQSYYKAVAKCNDGSTPTDGQCPVYLNDCPLGYVDSAGNEALFGECYKDINYKYYSYGCDIGYTANNFGLNTCNKTDPDNTTSNETTLDDDCNSLTPPANNCSQVLNQTAYEYTCTNGYTTIDSGLISCPSGTSGACNSSNPPESNCYKDINYKYYSYSCPIDYATLNYGFTTYTKTDPDTTVNNETTLDDDINSPTPPTNNCVKNINYTYYDYLCSSDPNIQNQDYVPQTLGGNCNPTDTTSLIDTNNDGIGDSCNSSTPPANNCKREGFTCNSSVIQPAYVDNQWKCSPFPCVGGDDIEDMTTDFGSSDSNNDGWDSNGGCSGQIYIFGGSSEKCRNKDKLLGLTGGGCCDKEKVALGLINCKSEEKKLAIMRDGNKCHYVGNFVSKKIKLGFIKIPIQYSDSYCCYKSTLARIIAEQGKPQLNLGFGSAEDPTCRGFTPEEFQKLDLSMMDLSEFTNSIDTASMGIDQTAVQQNITNKVNSILAP